MFLFIYLNTAFPVFFLIIAQIVRLRVNVKFLRNITKTPILFEVFLENSNVAMLRKWRKHPANTCIVKAFRKVNEDPILHCTCHYFDLNQKHGFNGYGTNQTKSEVVKWNSFVKFISHQQFWEYLKEKIVYETNFCEIKSTRKKKMFFRISKTFLGSLAN